MLVGLFFPKRLHAIKIVIIIVNANRQLMPFRTSAWEDKEHDHDFHRPVPWQTGKDEEEAAEHVVNYFRAKSENLCYDLLLVSIFNPAYRG